MPRIVDHDQRREELCLVAARLIHERGLDGATVRAIAAAAGCSTGVIVHYFEDKDDLLRKVLQFVNRRPIARIIARLEADPNASSIAPWIEEVLPIDDERSMEWKVRLAVWGRRPDLQAEGDDGQPQWFEGALQLVELGQERGIVDPKLNGNEIAAQLTAVVSGVALQGVLSPEQFPPEWQCRFIAEYISSVAGIRKGTASRSSRPPSEPRSRVARASEAPTEAERR